MDNGQKTQLEDRLYLAKRSAEIDTQHRYAGVRSFAWLFAFISIWVLLMFTLFVIVDTNNTAQRITAIIVATFCTFVVLILAAYAPGHDRCAELQRASRYPPKSIDQLNRTP